MKNKTQSIVFDIKDRGIGDDDAIWTLTDNSIFATIEVEPIPFRDLSPKNKLKIKKLLSEKFWSKLTFPVEILVRPVNLNFQKKLMILQSLLSYSVRNENSMKLTQYFNSFWEWFEPFVKANVKPAFRYFITCRYSNPYDNVHSDDAVIRLNERLSEIEKFLKDAGYKSSILSNNQINNLYESLITPQFYINNTFLFPDDWINMYKKSKVHQDVIPRSKALPQKLRRTLSILKDEIHSKGILYVGDINKKFENLNKSDVDALVSALETDVTITKEDDVLTLSTIKSSTEQQLYKFFLEASKVSIKNDHIQVGQSFYRGFITVTNPENIKLGFFDRYLDLETNMAIAIHVEPESPILALHDINHSLDKISEEINSFALQGKIIGDNIDALRNQEEQLKKRLQAITDGKIKPFKLNLAFLAEETSLEDLDFLTGRNISLLHKSNFIEKMAINYQQDMLKSFAPSGKNHLKTDPIICTNNSLADLIPFPK